MSAQMHNQFYISTPGNQPILHYSAADATSFLMSQNPRHNIRSDSRLTQEKSTEDFEKLPALQNSRLYQTNG